MFISESFSILKFCYDLDMKLIMVAVVSQNEFTTRGNDSGVYSWASVEDKCFFTDLKSKHHLFIIGLKTYKATKIKPEIDNLRIVLTHKPEKYRNLQVKGQLEFVSMSATEVIEEYGSRFHSALVLGGSHVYQQFIDADLIDEIFLTIEPVNFSSGTPLLSSGKKLSETIKLPKPTITKLNNSGTILKHYDLRKA
jgi:dihydrofolate reductase